MNKINKLGNLILVQNLENEYPNVFLAYIH